MTSKPLVRFLTGVNMYSCNKASSFVVAVSASEAAKFPSKFAASEVVVAEWVFTAMYTLTAGHAHFSTTNICRCNCRLVASIANTMAQLSTQVWAVTGSERLGHGMAPKSCHDPPVWWQKTVVHTPWRRATLNVINTWSEKGSSSHWWEIPWHGTIKSTIA